jgi:hypothetical protein
LVADQPARRIGLVAADDRDRALAVRLAEGDGAAEADRAVAGRGRDLGGGAAGLPIAQVASASAFSSISARPRTVTRLGPAGIGSSKVGSLCSSSSSRRKATLT